MRRIQTAELSKRVVWHGCTDDLVRLIEATIAHCTCEYGNPRRCGAHQILDDQHTLDHLAFARSVMTCLVAEEWHGFPGGAPPRRAIGTPAWVRAVRSPLAISLFALLLMLAIPLPSVAETTPAQPIAAWQTR